MSVNFIYASPGAEKTGEVIKKIKDIKKKYETAQIIIIVPEQFSYTAEKSVTAEFGGTGLNGIEVLTFSAMTRRYLKRAEKKYLSDSGKMILLQCAVDKIGEENIYSGCKEKSGLVKTFYDVIKELKRYMITPQHLLLCAEKNENDALKRKLKSIAEIYEEYNRLLLEDFYDSEEDLTELSRVIRNERIMNGAYVFIDEFADFLPAHYELAESMLQKCEQMYITLPSFDGYGDLEKIPQNTAGRIAAIAQRNGLECKAEKINSGKSTFVSEEIKFMVSALEKLNNRSFQSYERKTEDIELFYGKDLYSEITYCARRIKSLTQKQGFKYSDIAVVCGNKDEYMHIISAVFEDYKIAYFADEKLPAARHPIIMTMLGMLDILTDNWSFEAVFGYLKSGYIYTKNEGEVIPLEPDDIDFIESYVLKYGIRGKKKWTTDEDWEFNVQSISGAVGESEYEKNDDNEKNERLNGIRKKIIKPIVSFSDKVRGRKKVSEFCGAFFEFAREIYLYEGIEKEIEDFNSDGKRNEAERFSKVWNIFVEMLDQMVTAIGDRECSREDFKRYLEAGLETLNIDIIPSSMDCVTVSEPSGARQKNVKALFVVGATRGAVPPENVSEGIFLDAEREVLQGQLAEYELEIGKSTDKLKTDSLFRFYNVLFTAGEKLIVSCPLNNFEGDAQMPSQFIKDLINIFPNISIYNDIEKKTNKEKETYSVKDAFNYMLENGKRDYKKNIDTLHTYFSEDVGLENKLSLIERASEYKKNEGKISEENAKRLYEHYDSYSVSRLNEFAQCPFMYFVKNGLKARPEEIWQIQKFDLGSLIHYAVCMYCERIEDGAESFEELRQNWLRLEEEQSVNIVQDIMSEIKGKISAVLERDEGKVDYLLRRMTKTLVRSSKIIRESMIRGEYAAVEREKEFLIRIDFEEEAIAVRGIIDRIDMAVENEERVGLRVIDYKSGKKDFSVVSVSNMQDIQLVVYAMAALQLYDEGKIRYSDKSRQARITGIMYNKLRDDFAALKSADEEAAEITEKQMKLNGTVILDKNETSQGYEAENAILMDKVLASGGSSSYLNIKLKKNGEFYSYSEVMKREHFEKIIAYVKENIRRADKRIKSGDVKIKPCKSLKSDACTYCEMREVCMFDEKYNEIGKMCESIDEAWEKINNT